MEECSMEQVQQMIDLFKLIQKKNRDIAFANFKNIGFTGAQLSVISILFCNPNIMLNELSERLGLSKSTVSELVKKLEAQGIITRNIPEDNRRIVRLSLSPDFIEKHDKKQLDLKYRLFVNVFKAENITFQDMEEINSSLKKIYNLLKVISTKNIW